MMLRLLLISSVVISTVAIASNQSATIEMIEEGGGVLTQVATGLEWAQSDNGSDIDWHNAGRFCSDKGAGWRLASVMELRSLHDKSGEVSTSCGVGYACGISPLFRLTGPWVWSDEANNSPTAWAVILTRGTPTAFAMSDATKKRALCVSSFSTTAPEMLEDQAP
jgi:hypothetical protein